VHVVLPFAFAYADFHTLELASTLISGVLHIYHHQQLRLGIF
jgi:hypothetical protein